jgi:pantoate--beta-alanine ligase
LAKNAGVDVIFYPHLNQIYPQGYRTYVEVEKLGKRLCGKSRPGHFRGVTTIVSKLFHIVQPDIVYFGQKDAQQAIIIKRMVTDLNMPLAVKVMPTVREKDGLAMSSRNNCLNPIEKKDATVLYQALKLARQLIRDGLRDRVSIIKQMYRLIKKKPTAKVDYIEIVDLKELKPVQKIKDKVLIVLAVRIGKTRLIDNVTVTQ